MEKVIFCNIAWMKYYRGITDEDTPKNGGAYVKRNNYGGEVFNFLDYNRDCYGYVMPNGELHLERFDKSYKHQVKIDDLTVVWVSTDGKNKSRIVGWYKNAEMYRYMQSMEHEYFGGVNLRYNFKAKATDCYLLPEKSRTYVIPRAQQEGKGHGMGQSNVWYADSEYGQEEFVPKVLQYIQSYEGEFIKVAVEDEEIYAEAKVSENDVDKLIERSIEETQPMKSLQLANSALKLKCCYETIFNRADAMRYATRFNEAVEDFRHAIELNNEDKAARIHLMNCYVILDKIQEAIRVGKELANLEDDQEELSYIYLNLAYFYLWQDDSQSMEMYLHKIEEIGLEGYVEQVRRIRSEMEEENK